MLSGAVLHKLYSSVEFGIRNAQSIRHILLDPVYSRQHPPYHALEDSRERRWWRPIFKKRRGLHYWTDRYGWEQYYVRIEFRARIFTDFLGFLVYYPAFFKTLKARLVRGCSLCSLPVPRLPSTTWKLSENMAEFPGPVVVHNTCALNLSTLDFYESWLLLLRMGAAYVGVVCAGMWVPIHDNFWEVTHIGYLLGYTEVESKSLMRFVDSSLML